MSIYHFLFFYDYGIFNAFVFAENLEEAWKKIAKRKRKPIKELKKDYQFKKILTKREFQVLKKRIRDRDFEI